MCHRGLSVFALSKAHVRDPLRLHFLLRGTLASRPTTTTILALPAIAAAIPVPLRGSIPALPFPRGE